MQLRAGSLSIFIGVAAALILASYFMPFAASAAEVSAQTVQLLPPGLNVCQPLETPALKEYVYDGELHSFDLYFRDPSYVAVAVAVGETELPFTFVTRSMDASGMLRMHVDTPSIPLAATDPIVMTLLSSLPGSPTCMTSVVVHLDSGTAFSDTDKMQQPAVAKAPAQQHKKSVSAPKKDAKMVNQHAEGEGQLDQGVTSAIATGSSVTQKATLEKICETPGGAARLWTILLAVYFLIIAATILALPEGKPSTQSSVLLAIAIGVPLLVLLSVWKSAPTCHVGTWAPVIALLIAGAGIVLGFRHHPTFAKLLSDKE